MGRSGLRPKFPIRTIITGAQRSVPGGQGRVARGSPRPSSMEILIFHHKRLGPPGNLEHFLTLSHKEKYDFMLRFPHSLSSPEAKVLQHNFETAKA